MFLISGLDHRAIGLPDPVTPVLYRDVLIRERQDFTLHFNRRHVVLEALDHGARL